MGWDGRKDDALPRMDWYPRDYLSDPKTRGMTWEEHGLYTLLLWMEWIEGPLPTDHDELATLAGGSREQFDRAWKRVGRCFTEKDGRLVNGRMERERDAALSHREERRESGRKGNAKRWDSNRSAIAQRSHSDTSPGDRPLPLPLPLPLPSAVTDTTKQPSSPSAPPQKVTRTKKPPDPMIALLSETIVQPKKWCAETIAVLRKKGWDDARLKKAISDHGRDGMKVDEWTRLATGYTPTVARPQPNLATIPASAPLPAGTVIPKTREEMEAAEAVAKKRREEEDARTRERMKGLGSLTDRLSQRWGVENAS